MSRHLGILLLDPILGLVVRTEVDPGVT